MPHPPYSPDPSLSDFYLFPWMKKVLKWKSFADVEDMKQKMAEALKGIKTHEFKTVLSNGKRCLDRYIASNGEYFEEDKFKQVRINT